MPPTTIPGFTGTVIRPDETGYDPARAIWNAMHDRRPADDLTDGLVGVLLDGAASLQSPISQIELPAMGGAIGRVDPGATAFPFRQARWLVNIPATWRDAADDEDEIAWARGTYAAVKPYLSEGNYVNFMGDDEDDTAAGAFGRTIERLQRVKALYDPDNVFRLNQNIRPAGSP
jgi:FAD/FMN-containing dehydrogenase